MLQLIATHSKDKKRQFAIKFKLVKTFTTSTLTCSKLTIEILEQGRKYVQR